MKITTLTLNCLLIIGLSSPITLAGGNADPPATTQAANVVAPTTQETTASAATTQASQLTVTASRFVFTGKRTFSDRALMDVVNASLATTVKGWPQNRQVTAEDLEEARLALTRFYVNQGYINSGAVLPDQNVDSGTVTYQIVEGRLSEVNLKFVDKTLQPAKRHLLRRQYVIDRVKLASGPPLNILRLKDELELLRQDPNIQSINAEMKPGPAPGDGILDVQVQPRFPIQLGAQFSNRRPPSVGSNALDILFADSDLTGHGDPLNLRYDLLSGPFDDLRLEGAESFGADYALPISPVDTTLSFQFVRSDTVVLDNTFAPLSISSQSDSSSITLRQPIWRRPVAEAPSEGHRGHPALEFDVFATGSLHNNHTSLLGQPFSFSPGDVNGTERITVGRFGQELTLRGQSDAFSARSTLSIGLPWFDATPHHGAKPGGDFVAWLGQTQYVHAIGKTDVQLVLKGTVQLLDRSLLTLEQFALGGIDTVRGYPENDLVRDQGVSGTFEFHVPVWQKNGAQLLTLIPFFDAGYGWNRRPSTARSEALASPGLGLVFNPNTHFNLAVFYGVPLQNLVHSGRDPQDLGLHFNVQVFAF